MNVPRLVDPDDEPVVILDDEAGLSVAAREYLKSQGISEATAAAFRVGQMSDADLARLIPASPKRRAYAAGLWLPTFDPRLPAAITGLIRLTPAQNLHGFRSRPAGLAGPVDLDRRHRVVLTDNPLLALRLYQVGVVDVAHAEDPAVLAPLQPWFATREVLLLSTKAAGIAGMRSVLGEAAPGLVIPAVLDRFTDEVRALLGIAPKVAKAVPSTPLSLVTVRDLHEFSVRQLESEGGRAALRAAGLDQPDIVAAYKPGFLPEGYRDHLLSERHHFDRAWKGNAIVLPAIDERGILVDILAYRPESNHVVRSLWPEPRGLLASVLTTACDSLVVTDVPRRLGRLTRDGIPPLLLRGVEDARLNAARIAAGGVRSVEVHAHRDGEAIGAALAAAGITVHVVRNPYGNYPGSIAALRAARARKVAGAAPAEAAVATPAQQVEADEARQAPAPVPVVESAPVVPPAPEVVPAVVPVAPEVPAPAPAITLPTLALVEHDRQAERAIFAFGAGTYTVTVPYRPTSTLSIDVTGPKRSQRACFDLAVDDARRRNAAMLALSTGLPGPEVSAALVALLPAVLALVEPRAPSVAPLNPTAIPMRADERDEALALLKSDDLVSRMVVALGSLSADPDDPATTFALLAAVSRLADRPMWVALFATMPSERFPALVAIAQATPPDQVIHVTRLSAEALNHQDPEALRHRLVILGDAAEITDRAATSLRLLHDRGVIATSTVGRSTQYGGLRTRVVEVHGPIAVLAASTGSLPHGLDHHLFGVPVDDSHEAQVRQRQAEVAPMADPAALAASQRQRASAIRRLHNAQRLLVPRPVAIPDLGSIALPAALARNRLHHDTLVGLIQASALLHQHQRPTVEGCIVATSADTDLAVRLLHHVAALQSAGMSRSAHRMLTTLWASKRTRFSMDDLDALLPGWTRWAYRVALDELVALDFVAAGRGGRGKRREYMLVATAPRTASLRMPVAVVALEVEAAHG